MAYTTRVTNRTGDSRHFGFIPPHGKDLDDNEYADVRGLLDNMLNARELASLDAHIAANEIEIDYSEVDVSSSSSA